MLIEIDGEERQVATGRDALALAGPHAEMVLLHRRADGAVLRLAGTSARGFVVDVEGGHTGTRTSASRSVPASTVATMLDRFAANDTGWPGATVWADETLHRVPARRRSPLRGVFAMLAGAMVAVVAVALLRREVTVPWLCGRDGREVDTVSVGSGGLGLGSRGGECRFVDGTVADVFDLGAGVAWAETIGSIVALIVVWYLATRVLAKLLAR